MKRLTKKLMYYVIDHYTPNKLKAPLLLNDHFLIHELAMIEPEKGQDVILETMWIHDRIAGALETRGFKHKSNIHLSNKQKEKINTAARTRGVTNSLSEDNPPPLKDVAHKPASSFFREDHKMQMSFSSAFAGPGKDVDGGYLIENQCLLGVGAWKGAAMPHAIWHSPEYLQKVLRLMQEKTPLCVEHSCYPNGNFDPTKAYGFIFNQRIDPNGDLMGDIMVKNSDVVRLVKTGHFKGVSFNAQAIVCPERRYAMEPTAIMESSFVINPACKVSYFPGFNN